MRHFTVCVSGFEVPDGTQTSLSPTGATARRLGTPEVTARLATRTGLDISIVPVMVPLSFKRGWPCLEQAIERHHPCLTVILGHRGGMHGVTLPRSAVNRVQTDRPDDDGCQPLPGAVLENGPAAFWTHLPLSRVLAAFADAHVPASLSSDAGTYVCNFLFYRLMDRLARTPDEMGGLLCLPDYAPAARDVTLGAVGLSADQMLAAGEELLATTLVYENAAMDKKEADQRRIQGTRTV